MAQKRQVRLGEISPLNPQGERAFIPLHLRGRFIMKCGVYAVEGRKTPYPFPRVRAEGV